MRGRRLRCVPNAVARRAGTNWTGGFGWNQKPLVRFRAAHRASNEQNETRFTFPSGLSWAIVPMRPDFRLAGGIPPAGRRANWASRWTDDGATMRRLRCTECAEPVTLPDEGDVRCPMCGSRFLEVVRMPAAPDANPSLVIGCAILLGVVCAMLAAGWLLTVLSQSL